jgi:hypothetical protein
MAAPPNACWSCAGKVERSTRSIARSYSSRRAPPARELSAHSRFVRSIDSSKKPIWFAGPSPLNRSITHSTLSRSPRLRNHAQKPRQRRPIGDDFLWLKALREPLSVATRSAPSSDGSVPSGGSSGKIRKRPWAACSWRVAAAVPEVRCPTGIGSKRKVSSTCGTDSIPSMATGPDSRSITSISVSLGRSNGPGCLKCGRLPISTRAACAV